jgi:hypothetical protein
MDVTTTCPCSGTPHPDGDTVTLRDKPTLMMGTTALGWAGQQATDSKPTSGEISEMFLRLGILSWTYLEDDGTPKPVTDETLDWLLDDYELAYPVAEKAAELYTEVIFAPLLKQISNSSRTGRTNASTSANSRRSRSRPSPSEPSSITSSEAS